MAYIARCPVCKGKIYAASGRAKDEPASVEEVTLDECNAALWCCCTDPKDTRDALLAEIAALKAANAVLTEDVACMEEDSVEMRAVCWEYNQANEKLLAALDKLKEKHE